MLYNTFKEHNSTCVTPAWGQCRFELCEVVHGFSDISVHILELSKIIGLLITVVGKFPIKKPEEFLKTKFTKYTFYITVYSVDTEQR